MTAVELHQLYHEHHQLRGYHPRSLRRNRREFLGFFEALGIDDVHQVDADSFRAYWHQLMGRYPERTAEDKLRRVVAIMRWAVRKGILFSDPTRGFTLRKAPELLVPILTLEEVIALLAAPETTTTRYGMRDKAILELFYGTGLRISELHGLDLADISFTTCQVQVRRTKGGGFRAVPFGANLAGVLEEYLQHGRPPMVKKKSGDALFLSCRGTRLSLDGIGQRVRDYVHAAGIQKHVTPHSLRHAYATHLLADGATLHQVQLLLGHAVPTSTERYTRLMPLEIGECVRRHHPRGRRKR